MGNSGGKARDPSVKKRTKKKGKRNDRPVSDPTGGAAQGPDEGHALRRAGSEDITGRYAGGNVSLSPNPLSQDDQHHIVQGGPSQPSTSVAGSSALANEAVLNQYKKRLQQVLSIWPELAPLNDLDLTTLRSTSMDALQTLYKNAYDEYQEGLTLSKQRADLKEYVSGLEKRCQNQDSELHRKENQIETLDHELQILTGELRRRGIEPRLLDRGSRKLQNEPPSDYDTIPFDDGKGALGGVREERALSGGKNEEEDPYSLNKKKTMYVATPLLQAEGVKGLGSAIRRSQSLRSSQQGGAPPQGGAVDQGRAPDTSRMVDDLNRKLRTVQHSLEEERKLNKDLQDRLETTTRRTSVVDMVPSGGPTPETLTRQFEDLEAASLSRVVTSLFMILSRVPHADVAKFLCDTMLVAYDNAADLHRRFQSSVHSLLTCPVNPDSGLDLNSSLNKRVSGSQLRKFNFEKGPPSTSGSRLAQRTRASTELPKYLEEEVINFIRLTSDSTNVEPLVEVVWESLSERWPGCAIPTVLNHNAYSDFLHQCCRLAWQLNTTLPACYVTVDKTMRYDERYHTLLPVQEGMNASIGAEIDFYAWPLLYRKKYGEILHRGRVALNMRL